MRTFRKKNFLTLYLTDNLFFSKTLTLNTVYEYVLFYQPPQLGHFSALSAIKDLEFFMLAVYLSRAK